jgi:acyl carrier protein
MDRSVIRSRLEGIVREFFANDALRLADEMTAADVPGWDSLAHIELVVLIEQDFGVRFRATDVQSLENVGTLIDLISARAART